MLVKELIELYRAQAGDYNNPQDVAHMNWALDTIEQDPSVYVANFHHQLDVLMMGVPYHRNDFVREMCTRWKFRVINGKFCIGMDGNLDTIHDATIMITGGFLNYEGATKLAEKLVADHNKGLE